MFPVTKRTVPDCRDQRVDILALCGRTTFDTFRPPT